MPVDEPENLI